MRRDDVDAAIVDRLVDAPDGTWGAVLLDQDTSSDAPRGPGRPAWDPTEFWSRYEEAVAATRPPITAARIAEHFVQLDGTKGIDPDHLRKLKRDLSEHRPG